MPLPFQTLQNAISLEGIALHCGKHIRVTLHPSDAAGWTFRRTDLDGAPSVAAKMENVVATQHATVLQNGAATVSTTEHLLAALYGLGVTHCEITLDGPELPILDGSALGWVEAIQNAGIQTLAGHRPILRLQHPVWFEGSGAQVLGLPLEMTSEDFRVSVGVHFDHPFTPPQTFDCVVSSVVFEREIAAARTFTLEAWLQPLRDAGLIQGGSLENAVVFLQDGPSSSPRMESELARHKALDLIGDLALLFESAQFVGHIVALRAGHGPHQGWMQKSVESGAFINF